MSNNRNKRSLSKILENHKRQQEGIYTTASDNKKERKPYDPKEQAEGLTERFDAAGIDAEKETDERNILERGLNLKKDQNVLFDFFEVMNRPQNALFGGLENLAEGESFGQGLADGIRGRKDTQFKDVLNTAGLTEETEGTIGVDDVLGFAGDVMLDPMNIPIFPAKGVTKASKAVMEAEKGVLVARHGVEAAEMIMKTKKGAEAIQDSANAVNSAKKVTKEVTEEVTNAGANLTKAKEALETADTILMNKKYEKAILPTRRRTASHLAAQGIGSGVKGIFHVSDTAATKFFTWSDNRFTSTAAKQGVDKLPQGLQTYNNIKRYIQGTFNYAKTLPKGLMDKVRTIRGKETFAKAKALEEFNAINRDILMPAKIEAVGRHGMKPEEFDEMMFALYEYGDDLFDNTGKVKQGMSRNLSLSYVLTSDTYLTTNGVTKETAAILEEHIKQYMPEFYESHITNGTMELWKVHGASGKFKESYVLNKDLHEPLKESFKSITGDDNIKTISGLTKEESLAHTKKVTELNGVKEQYTKLTQGKDGHQKTVVPYDSPNLPKIKEAATKVDNANLKVAKQTDEHDALLKQRENLPEGSSTKVIDKRIELSAKRIDNTKKSLKKVNDDYMKIMNDSQENVGEALKRVDKELEVTTKAALGNSEVISKNEFRTRASSNTEADKGIFIKAPIFYTDDYVKQLETLVDDDNIKTYLAGIHMFNNKYSEILTNVMESGLEITPGYLAHSLTKEWADFKVNSLTNKIVAEKGEVSNIIGNSSAYNSRKYIADVATANELARRHVENMLSDTKAYGLSDDAVGKLTKISDENIKMFATDMNTSLMDHITKGTKTTADSWIFAETLKSTFLDPNAKDKGYFYLVDSKDTSQTIPFGYVKVELSAFSEKFNQLDRYIHKDAREEIKLGLQEFLATNSGKSVYIDRNINRLISLEDMNKQLNPVINMMDKLNTIFKKNKLLSPGFQLRNISGNASNMTLAGVPFTEVMKRNFKSHKGLKQGQALMAKMAGGGVLTAGERKIYEEFAEFAQHGFMEYGNALHDIPEELLRINTDVNAFAAWKKQNNKLIADGIATNKLTGEAAASYPNYLYNKLVAANANMNAAGDRVARYALWSYAKDNPQWLIENGYQSPQEAVRMILFDYQDLSVAEQEVMKRIIPFYTFTKKNVSFQMQNLMKNTDRYKRLVNGYNSLWGTMDLEDGEVDRFKLENFWVPIPAMKEDGTYYTIKSALPIGDLGEFLENPLQRTIASTAPMLRAPFEMAANTQMFSGMPIQEYKGQKGHYIPELPAKAEYLFSQTGLDVPAMGAFDVGRAVGDVARGDTTNPLEALQSGVGRSLVSESNKEKTAQRTAYNELDNLQDLLRKYNQRGIDIPTMAEINNKDKFASSRNIIRRLRAMR